MENDDELKNKTLEDLLYMEFMKGYIPDETYSNHNRLKEWWDNLDEWEKQQIILDDYKSDNAKVEQKIEPQIEPHEHEEWEQNKYSRPGCRAGLAITLPVVFAIHSISYTDWYWSMAIFVGGSIVMRLLINVFDKVIGNPR